MRRRSAFALGKESLMNFDKYTGRGFAQAAQSLAQREGHQQFAPARLLKVLLDDPEALASASAVPAA
jgi:hypothetical protein